MPYLFGGERLPQQAGLLNEETSFVAGDGLYYYDNQRKKWLSAAVYTYEGGAGGAVMNAYLLMDIGGRMTSAYAYNHHEDLTLVGMEYVTETASVDPLYAMEVRSNGVSLYSFAVGVKQSFTVEGLDVDFPKNVGISFFANGVGLDKINVRAYFRRKKATVA